MVHGQKHIKLLPVMYIYGLVYLTVLSEPQEAVAA